LNPAQHILVFAIRAYRWTISPAQLFLFGSTGGCRFTPTCSQYAIEVIHSRGILTGSALAAKRICRCHPWGGCGHDPSPKAEGRRQKAEIRFAAKHSL
jgi:putative membrane protein insertion efficiency factor